MTKSKSSTIAIVVLSVLLAAALASTIVLAAFSVSRTATTTITFGEGIEIEVSGISGSGTYYWNTSGTATNINTGNVTNATSAIALSAINIQNTSSANVPIYVIAKVTIEEDDSDVTSTYMTEAPDGWFALGATGWYIYGTNADTATPIAQSANADFVDEISIAVNEGAKYDATVDIYAVNGNAADAVSQLQTHAGYSA